MNIKKANELIKFLDSQIDFRDGLSEKAKTKYVKEKIEALFIPSLLENRAILRKSLRGKIIQVLRFAQSEQELGLKTVKIFVQACDLFKDENNKHTCPLLRMRINAICSSKYPQTSVHLMPSLSVEALKAQKKIENEKQKKERSARSLFRISIETTGPLATLQSFQQYLKKSTKKRMDSLSILIDFLEKHPGYPAPGWKKTLATIDRAWSFNDHLNHILSTRSTEERTIAREDFSKEMIDHLHGLKTEEEWLYCGSFGCEGTSSAKLIQKLFSFYQSTQVEKSISQGPLPDPAIYVEGFIRNFFASLPEGVDLDLPAINALFEDNTRHLPPFLENYLPEGLKNALSSWLRQGLLGNLMEFVEDGNLREAVLLASEQGDVFKNKDRQQVYLEKLQNKMIETVQMVFNQTKETADEQLSKIRTHIQHQIPFFAIEHFGTDFFSLPLWIKIKKEKNETYTVWDYHSGALYRGLKKSEFDAHFFERLLMHQTEPQYGDFRSKIEDIEDGLLATLKKHEKHEIPKVQEIDPLDMVHSLLIHSDHPKELVIYEMLEESFLQACQSFLKGSPKKLVIANAEEVQFLQEGIQALLLQAEKINHLLPADKLKALNATRSEINEAILKRLSKDSFSLPKNGLNLPLSFLTHLRTVISPEQIKSAKPGLVWALGEDFEPFIDAFIISLEAIPVIEDKNDSLKSVWGYLAALTPSIQAKNRPKAKGWLRTIIFSLYWKIGFQLLKFISPYKFSPDSAIDSFIRSYAQPLLDKGFNLLPEDCQLLLLTVKNRVSRIYSALWNQVLKMAFKACGEIVLFGSEFILEKEDAKKFAFYFTALRNHDSNVHKMASRYLEQLRGTPKIDYLLSSSYTPPKPLETFQLTPINFQNEFIHELNLKPIQPIEKEPFHLEKTFNLSHPIKATNVVSVLEIWNRDVNLIFTSAGKHAWEESHDYLCSRLRQLPYPHTAEGKIWQELAKEDISGCLMALHDISKTLQLFRSVSRLSSKFIPVRYLSRQILSSLCKLLTLTDFLGKRDRAVNLEGFEVNFYGILLWVKKHGYYLEQPQLIQDLEQFCEYFSPGFDIYNLPSSKELTKKASETLFYYPDNLSDIKDGTRSAKHLYVASDRLSWKEFSFFKKILDKPGMKEEFLRSILETLKEPFNEEEIQLLLNHLTLKEWLTLLFEEQHEECDANQKVIFPLNPAYCTLRSLVLISNELLGDDPRIRFKLDPDRPHLLLKTKLKKYGDFLKKNEKNNFAISSSFTSFWHTQAFIAIQVKFLKAFSPPNTQKKEWRKQKSLLEYAREKVSQSQILSNRHLKKSYKYRCPETYRSERTLKASKVELAEIYSSNKGQITRLLAFYKNNKKFLRDSYMLGLLERDLFKKFNLKKEMDESPLIVKAIGEFFNSGFDYWEHIIPKLPVFSSEQNKAFAQFGYLALLSYRYCYAFGPKHSDSFSNLRQKFLHFAETNNRCSKEYYALHALTYPDSEEPGLEEQFGATAAICHAHFLDHNNQLCQAALIEKRLQYLKWLPTIKNLLANPAYRTRLIAKIFQTQSEYQLPPDGEWKTNDQNIYRRGSLVISLESGTIYSEKLCRLVKSFPFLGGNYTFYREEGNLFETPDKRYILTLTESQEVFLETNYKGKNYQLIRTDVQNRSYWVEKDNPSVEKNLLVLTEGHFHSLNRIRASSVNPEEYYHLSLPIEDSQWQDVEAFSAWSHLLPLNRFCPISKMRCLKKPDAQHIGQIELTPYNLVFEVKKIDQELQACSAQIPGFHISKTQNHGALDRFPSYLLLENSGKEQKILIPTDNSISTFLWTFIEQPLGVFIAPWFNSTIDSFLNPSSTNYHEYTIKDDHLFSDNVEACFYLLLLYISQSNFESAERIGEQIEKLGRLQAFPATSSLILLILAVLPESVSGRLRPMRLKLTAVLKENQLTLQALHQPLAANETVPLPIPPLVEKAILTFSLIQDLVANMRETDPRNKIRTDQEWFIFTSIKDNLEFCIKSQGNSQVDTLLRYYPLDHLMEKFILPESLVRPYQTLKSTYAKEDSLIKNSLDLLAHVANTEPVFTQILNHEITSRLTGNITAPSPNWDLSPLLKLVKNFTIFKQSFTEPELIIFKKTMSTKINPQPPLTTRTFNRQNLIKYFFSYYILARIHDKKSNDEREQLKELLLLNKGGWDSSSNLLIEILDGVYHYPLNFHVLGKEIPSPLSLPTQRNIFQLLKEKKRQTNRSANNQENRNAKDFLFSDEATLDIQLQEFKNFFEGIRQSLLRIRLIIAPGSFIGDAIGKMALNQAYQHLANPGLSPFLNGLKYTEKLVRSLPWKLPITEPAELFSAPRKNLKADYLVLNQIDRSFDEMCKGLFSLAFEEVVPEANLNPLPLTLESQTLSTKLQATQNDLKHYYDNLQPTSYLKVKSEADLVDLYVSLKKTCKDMEFQAKNERSALLKSVNSKYSNAEYPLGFEDLLCYFLKGDFRDLGSVMLLPPHLYATLDLAIAEDLVKNTRLQQIERALRYLERVLELSSASESLERAEKLESLANELQAVRAYRFGGKQSVKLVRRFLMFEYLRNIGLWSRQVSRLTDLLIDNKGDAVIELLMSLGKSYFCIPTADSLEACRKPENRKLVINLWPASLAPTNIRQISTQSKEIFQQSTNAFTFNRSQTLSAENLHALFVVFQRAWENGESINMTPQDILSLDHIFFKTMYELDQGKNVDLESFDLLRMIHQLVLEKGLAIGDEAHEILNDKEELSWPVGPKKRIETPGLVEDCIRQLISHPQILEMIRTNSQIELSRLYDSSLNKLIAGDIARTLFSEIDNPQTSEFVEFVTGNCVSIPDWILLHEKRDAISLIKGVLTELLPLTLKSKVNVDYGRSKTKNEFAYVGNGNDNISDKSTNRNPYEILVKTMVMWLHSGINTGQINSIITYLYKRAENERLIYECSFEQTPSYQDFLKLNLPYDLDSFHNRGSVEMKQALEGLALNPHAILLYVRFFVVHQITYFSDNIRTNSQVLTSLFSKKYFDTGTPFNAGVYPPELKMLYDPGTIGEAMHLIDKKCPPDGIHLLKESLPGQVLDEVLQSFFSAESGFTALIDGGAQLTGMSNSIVADRIRKFAQLHRSDIKGIDFFVKDKEGNDQLMTLLVDAVKPIPYDQCQLQLHERLAYFDQTHGFGANIPQSFSGKGLLLLSPEHKLFKFLQEAFRMRGIKNFLKLLGLGDQVKTAKELEDLNVSKTQSIHIALTPEAQQALPKNPTLKDIFYLCIDNEDKSIRESHYHAYNQKIDNVIRAAVRKKILYAYSIPQMLAYFRAFKNFFIQKLEDDPKKLYGLLDSWKKTGKVLKKKREEAFKSIQSTSLFTQEEKEKLRSEILGIAIPSMPEKVHVFTDGKGNILEKEEDFGKSVNVEADTENDNEVMVEQQQSMQTQTALNKRRISPFTEWKWGDDFQSHSLTGLTFSNPGGISTSWTASALSFLSRRFSTGSKDEDRLLTPPLFRLQDLMLAHPSTDFNKVALAFDKRIWFSNNFLPRHTSRSNETPVNVGDQGQRNLYEILVHSEETDAEQKILSAGCLSIEDAAVWREKLKKNPQHASRKVFLYNIALRSVVAGDQIDVDRLRENSDFIENIECPLKFINGEVFYRHTHLPAITKWIKANDPKVMQRCFEAIYNERGLKPLGGSVLDLTFKTLN